MPVKDSLYYPVSSPLEHPELGWVDNWRAVRTLNGKLRIYPGASFSSPRAAID